MAAVSRRRRLRRESWGFALGSVCFIVAAVPWYASAVGPAWDAATFVAGSVLFTLAALIQLLLSGRRPPWRPGSRADALDWWSAAVQLVGTILFNVSTVAVLLAAVRDPTNAAAGWYPNAWGSIAFLVSSTLALLSAARRWELADPAARTMHGAWLNMVGSLAFGIAAVGAFVLPATGGPVNVRWMNVGTGLGALCFLVAAMLSFRSVDEGAADT